VTISLVASVEASSLMMISICRSVSWASTLSRACSMNGAWL
jgi:hypothetical protein